MMSPVISRRDLRQALGQDYLGDTIVGNITASWGTTGGLQIIDSDLADTTASGESLYFRHWIRVLGTLGVIQDVRVGSFNTGSGALISGISSATTIMSGFPYEIHGLLDPNEKDRAITNIIKRLRIQLPHSIPSVESQHRYSVGPEILDVLDVSFYADPTGSLNQKECGVSWWGTNFTGSLREIIVKPSLPASTYLVIRAITALTLGANDLATINIPSTDWILSGAAARCFWLLEQKAPGKEGKIYREHRAEMAREHTRLSSKFQPFVTRRIMLDEPW
jgi:hypothetical protein